MSWPGRCAACAAWAAALSHGRVGLPKSAVSRAGQCDAHILTFLTKCHLTPLHSDKFYAYGELKSVKKVPSRSCAFVTYATREAAEAAADNLAGQLYVKGERLKLLWGKPQGGPRGGDASSSGQQQQQKGQGPLGEAAFPPVAPAGAGGRAAYPSMDGSAMGSYAARLQDGGRGPPPMPSGGGGTRGPPPVPWQ